MVTISRAVDAPQKAIIDCSLESNIEYEIVVVNLYMKQSFNIK